MRDFLRLHVLRSSYRCRCGSVVPKRWHAQHEEFHTAVREFFKPPTLEEMHAAFASASHREPSAAPTREEPR